jgi:cytochrome P450
VTYGVEMLTTLILCVTFGILVFNFVKFFVDKRKCFTVKIPGANLFHPFIEFFYANYLLGTSNLEKRFDFISHFSSAYPEIMKFWLGSNLVIFINSPEKMQKVLMSSKCLEKWDVIYGLMDRNAGLIAGSVRRKWKEHRKFFNISFGPNFLENYRLSFEKNSKLFCDSLHVEHDLKNGEFDFFAKIKPVSLSIMCEIFAGFNANDYSNIQEIIEAYDT